MAAPTGDLLVRLGPPVAPFERQNAGKDQSSWKKPSEGETIDFSEQCFRIDATTLPDNLEYTTEAELTVERRYLWIINDGGLCAILERTANHAAPRQIVCHSNITAGGMALQAGEMWFISKTEVVINYKSGRYGASTLTHEAAVIEYFSSLGFTVTVQE